MKPVTILKQLDKQLATIAKRFDKEVLGPGEELTFSGLFSNRLFVICLIRTGVPYSLFDTIQDYTPLTERNWADVLDLSTKSLQRYKRSSRQFRPIQSEKIIAMAEVTNVGLDVFGEMDKFKLWLDTPNYALGKMKPMELLNDSYGKEMVIGELNRINHGILV